MINFSDADITEYEKDHMDGKPIKLFTDAELLKFREWLEKGKPKNPKKEAHGE